MTVPLPVKVKNYILCHNLISKGDGVLVGVSGGPDSLCLAHILLGLRESLGFEICLAHVNHSLRGVESEDDMDFVSRLSLEWDVTAIFETVDVYDYIFRKHLNLEEAARKLRYDFFIRAAYQAQMSKVAVGHTADDQVETVLMHLLRGSGTRGIKGMSPSLNWQGETGVIKVVRPLLDIWRTETEEYCRVNGLEYRMDSSNLNPALLRNRIRLEALPYLQDINKRVKESLLRLARIAIDEGDYMDSEAEKLYGEAVLELKPAISGEGSPGSLVLFLKTDKILTCHSALQRLLFFKALAKMYGIAKDLESHHIEKLRQASGSKAGTKATLPQGLLFLKEYEGGWLCHTVEEICPFPALPGEQEIPLEGETTWGKWTINTKKVQSPKFKVQSPDSRLQTPDSRLGEWPVDTGLSTPMIFRTILSLERAARKLKVRRRRDGDRFQPFGMDVAKKLQDFMTDEKIPRWWRDRIPLLCASEDILWVAGWRISELARVKEGDKKVIEVTLEIA